jgi:hypothetical protein
MTTNKPIPAGLTSLADFRPAAAPEQMEPAPVRAIAEAHGFVERNPVTPRKRRKGVDEPTHSFTARVTVRSANAFIEWCEQERMSYREGFDRLVGLIDRARQ